MERISTHKANVVQGVAIGLPLVGMAFLSLREDPWASGAMLLLATVPIYRGIKRRKLHWKFQKKDQHFKISTNYGLVFDGPSTAIKAAKVDKRNYHYFTGGNECFSIPKSVVTDELIELANERIKMEEDWRNS